MTGADEQLKPEQSTAEVTVCPVSLEVAQQITRPLLDALRDPESILYRVASERISGLPIEDVANLATLLVPDPSRSGVIVARYLQQAGKLPAEVTASPEKAVALWSANAAGIPKLKVPEGADSAVMDLGDRLQLRGGGPIIFAREEVSRMVHLPNTLLHVKGGARNAMRERLDSALAYHEVYGNPEQPIVATVDPSRLLGEGELVAVARFAPEAVNELELFVDSAIDRGFVGSTDNRYGVRSLPDGSSYLRMHHQNGAQLLVLAPRPAQRADGSKQSGVFNDYHALINHPGLVGSSFKLEGSNVIQVTSSHYGSMAVMNNLRAVHDLRHELPAGIESFRVVGDNQAVRTVQAHLIEIGYTTQALMEAVQDPHLRAALLET